MPSWRDLKRYCERDGWELYKQTDHLFYRKVLPDGSVLRTKVSRSSGQINGALLKEILTRQLKTDQQHFNDVI